MITISEALEEYLKGKCPVDVHKTEFCKGYNACMIAQGTSIIGEFSSPEEEEIARQLIKQLHCKPYDVIGCNHKYMYAFFIYISSHLYLLDRIAKIFGSLRYIVCPSHKDMYYTKICIEHNLGMISKCIYELRKSSITNHLIKEYVELCKSQKLIK